MYFEKKLVYAENTLEVIDSRIRDFVAFFNILKKIPYNKRDNINNLFSNSSLIGESPLFQNKSNLYFTKFLFPKEILNYLDLEKELQDRVKKLEKAENDTSYKKEIAEIGYLLQEKIISQAQNISTSFKKELEK
jgi:hypothetical protein